MPHPSKAKGDRYERAAVAWLIENAPDVLCTDPQRMLGAGRRDDVGDLRVFDDVAVQVRVYSDTGEAVNTAAFDAARQAVNGRLPYSLGLAPVPRATAPAVVWIASALAWPIPVPDDALVEFGLYTRAIAHVRDRTLGRPARHRIVRVTRSGKPPVLVAPIDAWLRAYRIQRAAAQAVTATVGAPASPSSKVA